MFLSSRRVEWCTCWPRKVNLKFDLRSRSRGDPRVTKGVMLHIIRSALTTGTHWCFLFCNIFILSRVIIKRSFDLNRGVVTSLWRHFSWNDVSRACDIICDLDLDATLALASYKPVYAVFIVKILKISGKLAGGCTYFDVITPWPEMTSQSFLHQKMRKGCPIGYAKFGGATRRRFLPT